MTETRSETHVECIGQGIGNLASGLLGSMGGCAMIGQSMINVGAGGRTRLSGISCAGFIALSVVAGSAVIEAIGEGDACRLTGVALALMPVKEDPAKLGFGFVWWVVDAGETDGRP